MAQLKNLTIQIAKSNQINFERVKHTYFSVVSATKCLISVSDRSWLSKRVAKELLDYILFKPQNL